jgi:hypothetical protein
MTASATTAPERIALQEARLTFPPAVAPTPAGTGQFKVSLFAVTLSSPDQCQPMKEKHRG